MARVVGGGRGLPREAGASLLALGLVVGCADVAPEGVTLRLGPDGEAVVVTGLESSSLEELRRFETADWHRRFIVETAAAAEAPLPLLAGRYSVEEDEAVFRPAFPFLAGRSYRAVWTGAAGFSGEPLELRFSIPERAGARGRVSVVFPSGDLLPENLLRLYIHFSVPMSEGQAADNLRLLRSDGSEVERPFAVPDHELWNRQRDRLTVLLDPGRIKREVRPNLEVGPPLQAGQAYRLIVDAGWHDSQDRPLLEPFEKRFRVIEPQRGRVDVESWRLAPPAKADDRLTIEFPRSLDHALLESALSVWSAAGEAVPGHPKVGAEERSWRFAASEGWTSGLYYLRIDTALEDATGNSVRAPFEVVKAARAGESGASLGRIVELPFVVDLDR